MSVKRLFSLQVRRKPLIEINELNTILAKNESIKVLNSSQPLPPGSRPSDETFLKERIKGSQFFDYNLISDTESNLPHMMPSLEIWKKHMERLNIRTTDSVVIYDDFGIAGACRAYWMFKVFNDKQDVYILNSDYENYKKQSESAAFIEKNEVTDSLNCNKTEYDHNVKDEGEFVKNEYSIASLELVQ